MGKHISNYKEIAEKLVNKLPFTGNSAWAIYDDNGDYCVYSYNTLIYKWRTKECVHVFNSTRFSITTSKLQTMLRRIYNIKY